VPRAIGRRPIYCAAIPSASRRFQAASVRLRPSGADEGHTRPEIETDDKGRPYVMGEHPVGVNDDRHICTFAAEPYLDTTSGRVRNFGFVEYRGIEV
jgi:hypothetical protein